jgi:predicted TPR repeat methyltransferase
MGLFVFTLFPNESDEAADYTVASNYRLAQSGCFRHGISYVERLAQETGFSVVELQRTVHEHDQDGIPISGVVAVLQVTR